MKRLAIMLGALLAVTALAGCEPDAPEAPPAPRALSGDAIGHYCGMTVREHAGPKGQIVLASRPDPVWFTSVRDAISFTMLPEEPKDIRAIYVSDMANAPSWDDPGPDNWTEAREAFFVIGSKAKGGMGAAEAVPFSQRSAAEKFAGEQGGRIVTFDEIPRDYVLGSDTDTSEPHGAGSH